MVIALRRYLGLIKLEERSKGLLHLHIVILVEIGIMSARYRLLCWLLCPV